ncbi:glycoside hydrolase family 65 protein [Companilactobacillus nuruki]|nr:glycosyl hydrolase family 65 protein [Companilactobacillus nuruki]
MKFCVDTDKRNSWYIGTDNFDTMMINKIESVMFQGNGYLGIRGVSEERQLGERRDMFVAGTFDAFPGEVTELPNLPDLVNMEIKIDKESLSLNDGSIEDYHKYLNLKNGELTRTFDWIINDKRINFRFSRFVSMRDKHLFVSKVEISSDQNNLNIQIRSGIDGQQSNSETQHMIEGNKRLYDGQYIQLMSETQQSHIKFAFNVKNDAYIDGILLNMKPYINMGRRQIFCNYDLNLNTDQKFTLIKYANVYTSIDRNNANSDLSTLSLERLKYNSLSNYDELLQKSTKSWLKNVWQKDYVKIDSDDIKPQVAINFARYQLVASTPDDNRMNIGAKGLTGEGYKGHTFWDTEIFMLPYYIYANPAVAQKLLAYRYLGLTGAHKKAQKNNYQGAQFPWEAAWPEDGETAPLYGSADIITGEAMKIWSGFIEQHITSDIVISVMEYLNATNDQEFAKNMGYEIILDAAKFWVSRLEYDEDRDRYEITNVIGPDEYKEHVNNNAFTNYTAKWCIQKAIKIFNTLKENYPDIYVHLNEKMNLKETYNEWIDKVNKIYLPRPNVDGVIPQDDQYLSKRIIDLSRYQTNNQVSDIFKSYNLTQIDGMQITKQADVLLLLNLFGDRFDEKIKRINWNYYEPKTTHDSSLSLSTHAMMASDLRLNKEAYEFYEKACEIDLGTHIGKASQGLHLAACGGIWNATVKGFGGLKVVNNKLSLDPNLPANWQQLQYQIHWHNSLVKVSIDHSKMIVGVTDGDLEFISHGQTYRVIDGKTVELDYVVEKS